MTGYQVFKSNGSLLETINVKSVDNKNYTSLTLIGQGIPNYGAIIAEDLVWLTENFASATPPINPLTGQIWYGVGGGTSRNASNGLFVQNGAGWDNLIISKDTASGLLAPGLVIDYTRVATTQIFSGNNYDIPGNRKFIPTSLLMIPSGNVSATAPPTFNVFVVSPGDVLGSSTFTLPGSSIQGIYFPLKGTITFSNGGVPIYMNVTIGATGGLCSLQTFIFGLVI